MSQSRLSQWIVPVPIPQVDHYLLAMRWIIILGVSAIALSLGRNSYFGARDAGVWLSEPLIVLSAVAGYNLLVSLFVWRIQPLAQGRVGWLLLADGTQAVLVTALTGGSGSFFSL